MKEPQFYVERLEAIKSSFVKHFDECSDNFSSFDFDTTPLIDDYRELVHLLYSYDPNLPMLEDVYGLKSCLSKVGIISTGLDNVRRDIIKLIDLALRFFSEYL